MKRGVHYEEGSMLERGTPRGGGYANRGEYSIQRGRVNYTERTEEYK